jgi:hypothetical protein
MRFVLLPLIFVVAGCTVPAPAWRVLELFLLPGATLVCAWLVLCGSLCMLLGSLLFWWWVGRMLVRVLVQVLALTGRWARS